MTFSTQDIGLIAQAMGEVIGARTYTLYACAIMPDHVHAVVRKHKESAEQKKPDLKTAEVRPAYFKLPLANLLIYRATRANSTGRM